MKSSNHVALKTTAGLLGFTLMVMILSADAQAAKPKNPLKPRQVTSFLQLKRMLTSKMHFYNRHYELFTLANPAADTFSASGNTPQHSETNVQVQGVDEGDSVKTDGNFIYRIQSNQVRIISAYPADKMALIASLPSETKFNPTELYLHGNQLLVLGTGWFKDETKKPSPPANDQYFAPSIWWQPSGETRTIARVYDITDRSQPTLQREIMLSGNYVSSRKVDGNVYLISRKYPNYYFADLVSAKAGMDKLRRAKVLPLISDSLVNNGNVRPLPLANLYFFPNFVEADYTVVAGFNLDNPNQAADIKAYLGGGEIIYASRNNLYLSAADYNNVANPGVSAPFTHLYKFALDSGRVNFLKTGEVPGTPLNQFSMDEHEDYFRIATTVNQWTQTGNTGSAQTWNNLYTLDSNMAIAGRLENLAPDERIYSARFMGDRAYMVTFKQVDPLFVIDLATPESPTVLGELKIPGFSTYLHPYDENHIIGFGQDTEVNSAGGVMTTGVKLALFDVTDVSKPAQLHSLNIGARSTYSPLLYDHKALLFDKTRGLMGFPISVTERQANGQWPEEIFQGAQVYKVSLSDGFQLQAAISHREQGESQYDWSHQIQRLLTIEDQLYTLSETRLQANDLSAFKKTGVLDFPLPKATPCVVTFAGADANICNALIDPVN
jgi:uncharacterized secreted protein with C-terminal beta-propeller domain